MFLGIWLGFMFKYIEYFGLCYLNFVFLKIVFRFNFLVFFFIVWEFGMIIVVIFGWILFFLIIWLVLIKFDSLVFVYELRKIYFKLIFLVFCFGFNFI